MSFIFKNNFIEKCIKIHGEIYDYSMVFYKNNKTKVKIICKTHGIFEQSPNNHIKGQGCPACSLGKKIKKMRQTTQYFIKKAHAAHNGFYDYSNSEYINAKTKIKIICPVHGGFWQFPGHHMRGSGCDECGDGRQRRKENEFKHLCIEKHNNKYDYSKISYKNANSKLIIICPHHGSFAQRANDHLRGSGCPTCGNLYKFIYNEESALKDSKLYLLKFKSIEDEFVKIGITTQTLQARFRSKQYDNFKISECFVWPMSLKRAFFLEQDTLILFKHHKHTPNDLFDGSTECFKTDILSDPLFIKYIERVTLYEST